MTSLARLPIRARITAAFAAVMVTLLFGLGLALYLAMDTALADELDTGLRFRADALAPVPQRAVIEQQNPALEEPHESFDQLLAADGAVLRSTPGIPRTPLLPTTETSSLNAPTFFDRHIDGVQGTARLLAVPLTGPNHGEILVVGSTDADRVDALRQLLLVLAIGGPIAVAAASYAGWRVAGWAMRPVERIQQQASAITASGLDRRLELPTARDELHRLTVTLNDMLGRLDEALTSERRFLQHAGHELRTPLAALKAELDLAQSAPRTAEELAAAIASAAEETDRLARLADDLLVLARAHDGKLPLRREAVSLRDLAGASADLFRPRALEQGQSIEVDVPDREVRLDPIRARQALDNLVDNALRHTDAGSNVQIWAEVHDSTLSLVVRDTGAGFDTLRDSDREGLGLRIASAIAASHGGELRVSDAEPSGAIVVLTFANATD